MQYEAIAWSGYLLRPVILIGAVIELYRGSPGPFVFLGVVGTAAEIGAMLLLPSLRQLFLAPARIASEDAVTP